MTGTYGVPRHGRCWAPVRGEVRAVVVVALRGERACVAVAEGDGYRLERVPASSLERRVCRYDLDAQVPR